jgi:hypothetical protein
VDLVVNRVGRDSYVLGQALSYPRCSVQAEFRFMLGGLTEE